MKLPGLLLSLILTQTCLAQFKLTTLTKNSIPKRIQYKGNIIHAVRWTDSTGDNIVVLTTNKTASKNHDGTDGALYAYHFLASGNNIKQTWKVYDHINECIVDMFLDFVDKSFAVTDLNNDGYAEVWIMYKVSCQGDVSPVPMKIIMYENNKKFAVCGTTSVPGTGGKYTLDEAFKNGPAAFRTYADKLWKEHKIETWNQ